MTTLLLSAGVLYSAALLALLLFITLSLRRFNRAAERSAAAGGVLESVTVVVAARNEAAHLPALLDALDTQDYPPDRLQFVVVDDASDDGTSDILADFVPARHHYRSIRIDVRPEQGSPKKEALRVGIAATDSALLLLTDADTIPPPGWARSLAMALSGGCPVVAGHSPSLPRRGLLGHVAGLWELGSAALAAGFIGAGRPIHVAGRNWGFRREVFEQVDGYSGLERALSGDDTLLAQKLARAARAKQWGFTLSPETQVPTHPPTGWGHFIGQRRRHMATGKRFRPSALAVAFVGFLVLTLLWLALVTIPWHVWRPAAELGVAMKVASDTLCFLYVSARAGERGLVAAVPLFSLFHLLVFPLLQLGGTLLPFRWKGRRGR